MSRFSKEVKLKSETSISQLKLLFNVHLKTMIEVQNVTFTAQSALSTLPIRRGWKSKIAFSQLKLPFCTTHTICLEAENAILAAQVCANGVSAHVMIPFAETKR